VPLLALCPDLRNLDPEDFDKQLVTFQRQAAETPM
jgi:hypothetical protein